MKKAKKLLGMAFAATCCLAAASCGSKGREAKTIAIGCYTTVGAQYTALTEFLKPIGEANNITFNYFETGYDSNSLLTAIQQQVTADAIISTMDGGTAIADYCEENDIYYAGYISDFDTSFESIKNYDHFLGTACDGNYTGTAWGTHIAERVIADGKKNVGLIRFPSYAYPHQGEMDAAFRAKIAEYNASCTVEKRITLSQETTEMPFFGFDVQAYLGANPGLDSIYAMCGGVDTIYPALTAAQKSQIALYSAGYNTEITSEKDFGEGNCIQEMVYCTVESIVYPLTMVINALDGKKFSDNPTVAQRIEPSQIRIETKDDLNFVRQHAIYQTCKFEDAFFTVEEFNALLAVNGGTHAKLVNAVTHLSLADLRTRNK